VEGCGSGSGRGRCEGLFERALVWGDVDPHGVGLRARALILVVVVLVAPAQGLRITTQRSAWRGFQVA
jgi:hypothetical protein